MPDPKVYQTPPVTNAPFQMAPCDIIIPFHGKENLVARLVQAIFNTVATNRYRITLVDDGSPSRQFLEEFEKDKVIGVDCLRHEKRSDKGTLKPVQLGFGASIQTALEHTKQPWVVIMHSDVLPEDMNWLSQMGSTLLRLKKSGVKMVSARSDNPMTGDERLYLSRAERDKQGEDIVLDQEFLPMYCVLCHRELFQRIGPIKHYPFAGYEDEEFAHRMRHYGFRQAICGQSWVHHEGGATIGEVGKVKKVAKEMEKNFDRCVADIKSLKNPSVMGR